MKEERRSQRKMECRKGKVEQIKKSGLKRANERNEIPNQRNKRTKEEEDYKSMHAG